MFIRVRIFLTFFALLSSLFGLSACSKASTPTGGGSANSNSWEKLPEIPDTDWIKPSYEAIVTNDSGATKTVTTTYDKNTVHDPIVFRPDSGSFQDLTVVGTVAGKVAYNAFNLAFVPDTNHVAPMRDQSMLESHSYLNGKLTYNDPAYPSWDALNTRLLEDNSTPQLKAGDSWVVIYVFKGTDGQMYKFTSPTMTAANATA